MIDHVIPYFYRPSIVFIILVGGLEKAFITVLRLLAGHFTVINKDREGRSAQQSTGL